MGEFGRRLLLAVDAEGYGRADVLTQREFQEAIARLSGEAADAAGLDRARWVTQEGGDSLFAVLPADLGAAEPVLVDAFMRGLDAGLRAFNHNRVRQAWLRLRAAVHFGPASLGANGFVGSAPVEIGRILDSTALRTALAEASDACLAVGVSAVVFHDVVRGEAYTSLRKDEFRQVRVEEKEYRGEAWIWVPGGGGVRELAPKPGAEPKPYSKPYSKSYSKPDTDPAVVRVKLVADEVAGYAAGVRTDQAGGTIESTAEIGRVEAGGSVVGVDIRTAGGEK
ncbi:hypothetical protein OG453_02935 [Streptomyces sp. NBC_01381]|uniref:hypothetical protein n=1 Tax=Streptomyces sp. NBC_01381 TaxID=2903845 RepID=UPI00225AB825|nr:hypothetical protein [Streptomyces sp. NBC_01381]MCX4665638.1 hypothetical protein [Streptomyces sp. NBC_01381]